MKKRLPNKIAVCRPVTRPVAGFAFEPVRTLNRLLQRWKECWRLAALPAPVDSLTGVTDPAGPASQQQRKPNGPYSPNAGMRGKHVEWVPCSLVVLDKMLDMAGITPDDFVIDPGSGDGRIVIRVAKRGARALGIEANPKLVALSRQTAIKEGVGDTAIFQIGDFFETDFSEATVVALFLRRDLNIKLRPRLLDLAPGTRIVSNIFDMGDWETDLTVEVEDEDYYFKNHTVHLWIVPAKVAGTWETLRGELVLSQKFQKITGRLTAGGKTAAVDGRINGEHIEFTASDRKYTGRVTGNRMALEADDDRTMKWIATLKN